MARYDASTAEILVFTFKDGLLSAVAHDLKLKATRFTLTHAEGSAQLDLDASSLRVVTAMKIGVESPGTLPAMATGEIEKNIQTDVLNSKRFPSIQFVSTSVSDREVVGQLTLHGHTHEVRGPRNGKTVEFKVDQRQFGIKPYTAMLGTLKVKPEVVVRVTIP